VVISKTRVGTFLSSVCGFEVVVLISTSYHIQAPNVAHCTESSSVRNLTSEIGVLRRLSDLDIHTVERLELGPTND
jgi:hypothetical protein